MSNLLQIFRFGWPYMRRYWHRLVAGILLGILFGASNASFVLATRAIVDRLTPKSNDTVIVPENKPLNLGIVGMTNLGTNLPLSIENGNPHLNVSNVAIIRFLVDSNATTVSLASSESGAQKKGKLQFLNTLAAKIYSAVDPWLPARDSKPTWQRMLGGFLLLPLMIAFRGYIGYLGSYCMSWVSERVIRDLRLDLLKKLNSLSLDYFNRATIGELLARVNGDTGALYRCMSLGFSDLIKEPISVVAILCALFWMNWKLTLMAIIFMPMTLVPIRILGKKVRRAVTSSLTAGMTQDSLLVEVFSSIRVVKAYCLEKTQLARFGDIYDRLVRIGMKSVQARDLVNPTVETISACGLGVVILFIFYYDVSIPDLMGFLIGVTAMYTPIKKLGNLHIYFQQASVGAQRLVDLFKQEPTVKENPNAKPLPQFSREIRFENVSFGYRDERPVLRNVNLTLPRGQKLGIAGESGSGKSTLVNLALRFYDPTEGRITIDGQDFRDVKVNDLRQQMALVSQEIVIFDQTAAANIACGREGATIEEVHAAARSAQAHKFISELPGGYDERLGERGQNLSVGQRQRISIARAFVRNAPILVLDEATAPLDAKTEAEVQADIDRLAEHRTVICIAHRLSTLANMDRVIVLQDGQIVEDDTFVNLVRANGIFADMARRQGIKA